MEKEIEKLIQNYKKRIQVGLKFLEEKERNGLKETESYRRQILLNTIWKEVIKDFQKLADKVRHERY